MASGAEWNFSRDYVRRCYKLANRAISHMNARAKGYPDESHRVFGAKGEIHHIHRKTALLKKIIWDGDPAVHESPEEILTDLIGHALLALDNLYQDNVDSTLKEDAQEFNVQEFKVGRMELRADGIHTFDDDGNETTTEPSPDADEFTENNGLPYNPREAFASADAPVTWFLPAELIDAAECVVRGGIASPELRARLRMFFDQNEGRYQRT